MIKCLPKTLRALYYANFYTPKRIEPQAMPEFHLMKDSPLAKSSNTKNVTFSDYKNYLVNIWNQLKSSFTKH